MDEILLKAERFADKMIDLYDNGQINEDLIKVEKIDSKVKQKIATTMHMLQENQEILEQIKQSNPDAYAAIHSLVQTMISVAKKSAQIDPHTLMHEKQIKDELDQQQNPQEEEKQQGGPGRLPSKDQPVHQKKQVYQPGEERRYTAQDDRIKQQDGSWKSFGGGLQDATEGQNGQ